MVAGQVHLRHQPRCVEPNNSLVTGTRKTDPPRTLFPLREADSTRGGRQMLAPSIIRLRERRGSPIWSIGSGSESGQEKQTVFLLTAGYWHSSADQIKLTVSKVATWD
jgi:hypothetical protein